MGGCRHSEPIGGIDQYLACRRDDQLGEGGPAGGIEFTATSNPVTDDCIFAACLREPRAALVWNLRGGLLQNEALIGADRIRPPCVHIACKRCEVGVGIFGFERELESALAVEVAVTGAGI